MNISDEYTVKIEKMVNEGYGLARINNIPVFISGACPEDLLKIRITKINKRYLNAEITDIIEPSKYRVKPICPMHNVCGSCDWQHIDYSKQLEQKRNIVLETLKNITGINFDVNETIPSPLVKEYRCKVQMPVSQTKVSKRILSGYYKKNSHELINIKYCPMQPAVIDEISQFIKDEAQKLSITGYDENTHSGLIKHIIYRISADNKHMLIIFVINSDSISDNLIKLSKLLSAKFTAINGICANFNTQKTNVILGKNTQKIIGKSYYIEQIGKIKYKISANSFFQVNPLCAEKILDKVKELISKNIVNPDILDAYSGVSTFGIWLSDIAKKVVSIEESESASKDAVDNLKLNNINNVDVINGDAALSLSKLIKNCTTFDVSVIDPPRKGCTKASVDYLAKLTKKYIVYVSCNVSTLARDIKLLEEYSFKPVYIQPADMFPNTYHVETIVLLEKF